MATTVELPDEYVEAAKEAIEEQKDELPEGANFSVARSVLIADAITEEFTVNQFGDAVADAYQAKKNAL